jgi:hypothetical protein
MYSFKIVWKDYSRLDSKVIDGKMDNCGLIKEE